MRSMLSCELAFAACLLACGGEEPAGPDAATTTDGADASSTTTGSTSAASSTGEPTTGAATTEGSTTGEPLACAPSEGPIAAEEFAGRFAEAVCAQKAACGCEEDFACVGIFTQRFAELQQAALDNGLEYDAACAGEVLATTVMTRGCAMRSQAYDVRDCWSGCTVFTGDVPTGGSCPSELAGSIYYFSEFCAEPGAMCRYPQDLCEPPLPTLGLGEDCFVPPSDVLGTCDEGLGCTPGTWKCGPIVGEGDSCADGEFCKAPLRCGPLAVCEPRSPAGAPCMSGPECASRQCTDGVCHDFVEVCATAEPRDLFFLF